MKNSFWFSLGPSWRGDGRCLFEQFGDRPYLRPGDFKRDACPARAGAKPVVRGSDAGTGVSGDPALRVGKPIWPDPATLGTPTRQ